MIIYLFRLVLSIIWYSSSVFKMNEGVAAV